MNRRELLAHGVHLVGLSLMGCAQFGVRRAGLESGEGERQYLIRQYLGGGLDPFSVLLPTSADTMAQLHKVRPNLLFKDGLVIPGEDFLLNPKLTNLHAIIKSGGVRIVLGAWSGSDSLSHFENIGLIENPANKDGILAGALAEMRLNFPHLGGLSFSHTVAPALKGSVLALTPSVFFSHDLDFVKSQFSPGTYQCDGDGDRYCEFLGAIKANLATIERIVPHKRSIREESGVEFFDPQALNLVTQKVIDAKLRIPFLTVEFPGFDTHADQNASLEYLLTEWDRQIGIIYNDLILKNQRQSINLLCYSEFGRALQQNGAGGTEHGRGGIAFLFSLPKNLNGKTIVSVPMEDLASSQYLPGIYPIQDLYREIFRKQFGLMDASCDKILPFSTKKVPSLLA